MRPIRLFGRPVASRVHVVPPSVDRTRPSARTAGINRPRLARHGPHRRDHHVRILRVDRQIHGAGLIAGGIDEFPRAAAVARAIDAALLRRREQVPEHRDVDETRVGRMDVHAADLARVGQAHMPPRPARVRGLVHADPGRDVPARARRSRPDVDHVRIGRRHRDRADRTGLEKAIRDVRPGGAGVRRCATRRRRCSPCSRAARCRRRRLRPSIARRG